MQCPGYYCYAISQLLICLAESNAATYLENGWYLPTLTCSKEKRNLKHRTNINSFLDKWGRNLRGVGWYFTFYMTYWSQKVLLGILIVDLFNRCWPVSNTSVQTADFCRDGCLGTARPSGMSPCAQPASSCRPEGFSLSGLLQSATVMPCLSQMYCPWQVALCFFEPDHLQIHF